MTNKMLSIKRIISFILLVFIITTVLVGCGKNNNNYKNVGKVSNNPIDEVRDYYTAGKDGIAFKNSFGALYRSVHGICSTDGDMKLVKDEDSVEIKGDDNTTAIAGDVMYYKIKMAMRLIK